LLAFFRTYKCNCLVNKGIVLAQTAHLFFATQKTLPLCGKKREAFCGFAVEGYFLKKCVKQDLSNCKFSVFKVIIIKIIREKIKIFKSLEKRFNFVEKLKHINDHH
jgi:hypothetical protein